jgi:Asp-tRNA(Asn)/Glu-tRNA(Gln) amidotransferase A subunit family amidase
MASSDASVQSIATAIAAGRLTAEAAAQACLDRIGEREDVVGAFEFIDPDQVLAEARMRDREPPRGPLHGVPVALKDTYDTCDMPTGYGSPIYAGHRPRTDAAIVAMLRAAGAVILGKTVTTEFAYWRPGKTANPRNPAHTPGGSSSGSAAAVADGMAPLAFGSQTAASLIRPAAYCGVVGYKASLGQLSTRGLCPLGQSLDTPGFMVRDVADIALVRSVLTGDRADVPRRDPHEPLRVGVVRTAHWSEADPCAREALDVLASRAADAGAIVTEPAMPDGFDDLAAHQNTVMFYEVGRNFAHEYAHHRDQLSEVFAGMIEAGRSIPYADYLAARDAADRCRSAMAEVFGGVDVMVAPSAHGEAPKGRDRTGDPLFCRMWTLLHLPCIHLPVTTGPQGLPVGAQAIGPFNRDGALIAGASWLANVLA